MQISVEGRQQVTVAPERADLSLTVVLEGAERDKVIRDVTAIANQIGREVEQLEHAGAAERHTVQPLRVHAWKKNRTSPERVTASVDLQITFTDFEALGRYSADLGGRDGVRLGWVNWSLTDATADRLSDECIEGAVARARQRAEAMARAAGAGAIEITEIAAPGLLGAPEARQSFADFARPMAAMAARGKMVDEPEAVQVVPQDIEIGAQLQLRFATP